MSQHVSRTTHVEALTYAGVPQLVVYPQVGVPELSGQIRGLICGRGGVSPRGVPHLVVPRWGSRSSISSSGSSGGTRGSSSNAAVLLFLSTRVHPSATEAHLREQAMRARD